MNTFNNITIDKDGKTAVVTINRPSKMNALNAATLSEIAQAFHVLEADNEVRGIILTGAGEKAFVAGADIQEFVHLNKEEAAQLSRRGHEEVMNVIYNFRKPVIAAINGFALGGGLELALACHLRIAVESAKVGLPEVSLGIIPGYGGTQRLTALVGRGKALEMIMTGDMITATEAYQWGVLNHVVTEAEDLLPKAKSILERTYLRSATAIGAAIEAVNAGIQDSAVGSEAEIRLFGECFGSEDMKEGVAAFLEKRQPNF